MIDVHDLYSIVDYVSDAIDLRCKSIGKCILRHWYAGCALIGNEAHGGFSNTYHEKAKAYVAMADAMLDALEEKES